MNTATNPPVASDALLADKCIVHGCMNRKGEGRFEGDICSPCFRAITTGIVGPSTSFIAAGSMSRSNGLLAVFEKYQHLDRVLRECETADDPIYRTCAQLWVAVAEAQTANPSHQPPPNGGRLDGVVGTPNKKGET